MQSLLIVPCLFPILVSTPCGFLRTQFSRDCNFRANRSLIVFLIRLLVETCYKFQNLEIPMSQIAAAFAPKIFKIQNLDQTLTKPHSVSHLNPLASVLCTKPILLPLPNPMRLILLVSVRMHRI
jgi:hypothetical protein